MIRVETQQSGSVSEPVHEKSLRIQLEKGASLTFSDSVTVQDLVLECQEDACVIFQTATHIDAAYIVCGERCKVLNMSVLNTVSVRGDSSCTALIHVRRTTNVFTEGSIQIHLRSIQATMWAPKTWFQSQCMFCIENQATHVALPCRHSTWCNGCGASVIGTKFERECCVCRSTMTSLYVQ